jgi:nicotinamidase-related amidase
MFINCSHIESIFMDVPPHPSGLDERVVAKVFARRGRLHAYESLNPAGTALVVVDLMRATVELDPGCEGLIPGINRMAEALRQAGGRVAWVTAAPSGSVSRNMTELAGADRAKLFHDMAQADDPRADLWPGLDARDTDIHVLKRGASAFFPGKCDLHERLREHDIDTLLIAGTVTNVCCESSARDAVELGYRVTMVSNAMRGYAFGLHEASLTAFYRIFGDVRPTSEILTLIAEGSAPAISGL